MRIDAHHHLWDLSVRDQPWTAETPALHRSFSMDELRPSLQAHHVDTTIVVQTVADATETPELLALAGHDPHVGGVVGWVDLEAPDVVDRLAELRSAPGGRQLVGIRHPVQDEPDSEWLNHPQVDRGLRAVAEAQLSYDLLVRPRQLSSALNAARAHPDLRFILDHAGKPDVRHGQFEDWKDSCRPLLRLPNVAVKLSGLVTEADPQHWRVDDLRPYTDLILDVCGAERTMFGSDWPVCLEVATYARVLEAAEGLTVGLSTSDRDLVFGGTASTWYRLGAVQ